MKKPIALLLGLVLIGFAAAQQGSVVKTVTIRGNVLIARDAILSVMRSKEGKPFLQSELPQDERSIRELGFFQDVKILSRSVADNEFELIVEVLENPVIKEIRVVGNTVLPSDQIRKLITQPVGQVLNTRTILPSLEAISKAYEEKGYFAQADVQPLHDSPNTLNVVVIERTVSDIVIQGLGRTKPQVIRRMMKTKPGEAFNEKKWSIDRRRLESTQWFETINGSVRDAGELGRFDLLLDVKEARTAQIGFGLALDPRSRLAGSARYTDTNFHGSGQTVGVNLQQDTTGGGTSASLNYVNPWMDSKDTTLSAQVYSRVNTYFTGNGLGGTVSPNDDRFDERRTGASVSFTRPFRQDYSATIGTTYENIKTINLRQSGDANFIQQDGDLAMLNLQLARDRRDVPLDPTEGDFARIAIEPGLSNVTKIGGNVANNPEVLGRHAFLRSTLEYKSYYSRKLKKGQAIDTPRPVIAVRARYGIIKGTVPFFEQLFVGGSDSLRGYPDQRFWGKQSFLASAEYRFPIQKSFNLIAFVDYGGAWGGYGSLNTFTQSNKPNFKLGFGPGVSFKTPLGPIRIDFGFNQEGGNRTHFSIGGSF